MPVATAVPESHCGGTRVNFPAYYTLKPKAASKARTLALQCLLKEKKRYAGKLTGDYNKATRKAAGAWMKSRSFAPTRTWRRENWVSLLAGQERPALTVGATGPAVSRVQRALRGPAAGRGHGHVRRGDPDRADRLPGAHGAAQSGTTDAATWTALSRGRF